MDLDSYGLQLDLIKLPLQQGSGSRPLSAKDTDIISLKIQKSLSKEKDKKRKEKEKRFVTIGSIPETCELLPGFLLDIINRMILN